MAKSIKEIIFVYTHDSLKEENCETMVKEVIKQWYGLAGSYDQVVSSVGGFVSSNNFTP
jgi:hypothetical protein